MSAQSTSWRRTYVRESSRSLPTHLSFHPFKQVPVGLCFSDEWPEQAKMPTTATLYLWHKFSSKTWTVLPLMEVVATITFTTWRGDPASYCLLNIQPRACCLPSSTSKNLLSQPLPGLRLTFTTMLGSFSPEVVDKNRFQQMLPKAWRFIHAGAF